MSDVIEKKPSKQEQMKIDSKFLKGDIAEELADPSIPAVSDYSYELLKFHGTYQGYNRDTATERKKAGLDKEYEFMLRLRIPAGRMTADQYLKMDELADKYANNTIRITTRQTFQYHVVLKENLKAHINEINEAMLSTLSACGDVVRNVTTSPMLFDLKKRADLWEDTQKIVELCEPKTTGYKELWTDAKDNNREADKVEPLYGETYLPRKFKIGIICPEDNSIDVFTHDLGFVAIYEGEELVGYNVLMGGGLGMKHEPARADKPKKTYARLANNIAFIKREDLLRATEAVVKLQRDHGDRSDRQHARLKYVVEENGIDWAIAEFKKYFGEGSTEPKEIKEYIIPDYIGWHKFDNDNFWGINISSGRVAGEEKEALKRLITKYQPKIALTADQNIILTDISDADKQAIQAEADYNIFTKREDLTEMANFMMACVSLPTCGKALAEAERVKLPIQDAIQKSMNDAGIGKERIRISLAGCPNGCSRPYVGDIGIVGRMPGHYVLFIGGDFEGTRLNTQIFDKVPEADIPTALTPFFNAYNDNKNDNEGFGDFVTRVGLDKLKQESLSQLEGFKWAS